MSDDQGPPPIASSSSNLTGSSGVFEAAQLGMAVLRQDGTFVRANDALCNAIAREPESVVGARLYDLVHSVDVASLLTLMQDVALGIRAHTRHDIRILTPSGEVTWFDLALCAYRRVDDQVQLLAVFVEITERKRQERVDHFKSGVGNATARQGPLIQLAIDLGRLFVPSLADGCVIEISTVGGGPLVRATHGDRFTEALLLDLHKTLRTKDRAHLPLRLCAASPDDVQRALGISEPSLIGLANAVLCVPMRAGSDELGTLTLVCTDNQRVFEPDDLTLLEAIANQLAEGLLRRAKESTALSAVKSRDEFLSIAAHELRTPLTPLSLALQQLRRPNAARILGEGTLRLLLERANRQAEHLARLVDDLLDVARISSGPLHLRKEPTSLSHLVKDVLDRLASSIERAGCPLHVTLANDAWGAWDRGRIEQVITNLIGNAIKYGAGQPIWIEVQREGDTAVFTVHDRGIGVPEDRLTHIFNRFERAETAERFEGLGLGLYIAKEIVTAHHGEIAVLSQLGRGSTFVVRLPADHKSHDPFASQNGHVVQST